MAVYHLTHSHGEILINLCDNTMDGFATDDTTECTCMKCLKIITNDCLIKIDELEDDLMVANRTIAVLSERKEN